MNPMVVAENLTKTYGHTRALDHANFTIDQGRIVGLVGPKIRTRSALS